MKSGEEPTRFLLVSDLDATLLHEKTYDCGEALPLLRFLAEKGIPLILASSKTRSEMEEIQDELGVEGPFVCENGGAVSIPQGYFPELVAGAVRVGEREVLELGCSVRTLQAALSRLAEETGLRVRTLLEMDVDEVVGVTGLSRKGAALAVQREYDLPFLFEGPGVALEELRRKAERRGLRVVRGGRLVHLMGDIDKGKAFSRLRAFYPSRGRPAVVVALGDSENDVGLLRQADIPVVVPKESGWESELAALPGARLASRPAPEGWVEEVRAVLSEFGFDPP